MRKTNRQVATFAPFSITMRCSSTGPSKAIALAAFLGIGFLCPTVSAAGQVKNDVKLFPREPLAEGTSLLVPYHTTRALQRRGQSYVDESELGLNLPALGESVHLLYGEGRFSSHNTQLSIN